MTPIVSVIIPTRNYGRFLPEAVESVFLQGLDEIEVIVVDDGSTDDTQEVLASIADSRLITIRLSGKGTSAARNAGLDRATGKYIAYLDADDLWLPNKLDRQLALMEAEPAVSLVFTNLYRFDKAGQFPLDLFHFIPELAEVPTRPSRAGGGRVLETDAFTSLATISQFPTQIVTCLLRHEAVKSLRFDERIGLNQDQHYMLRVYPLGGAAYFHEHMVAVRRHGRNSANAPLPRHEADVRVLSALTEEPFSDSHRAILNRRIGQAWAALGYHYYWNRSPFRAAKAYAKSLQYPGASFKKLAHLLTLPLVPFLPRKEDGWIEGDQRDRIQSMDSRTNG